MFVAITVCLSKAAVFVCVCLCGQNGQNVNVVRQGDIVSNAGILFCGYLLQHSSPISETEGIFNFNESLWAV